MNRALRITFLFVAVLLVAASAQAGFCPGYCAAPRDCQPAVSGSGGCDIVFNFCMEFQSCFARTSTDASVNLAAFTENVGTVGTVGTCAGAETLKAALQNAGNPTDEQEALQILLKKAEEDPAIAEILRGTRIVGEDGELYRGSNFKR